MHWLVVGLSLASAFASAMSTTLKKAAANRAARSTDAARFAGLGRPLWVAGLGCDVIGVSLQVAALHYGALALVQPLLVSGLIFALILRHIGRSRISARKLLWGSVLVGCLIGFLFFSGATIGGGSQRADRGGGGHHRHRRRSRDRGVCRPGPAHDPADRACGVARRRRRRRVRADGLLALVSSWQLYVVLMLGAAGQFLTQRAFQAGPITSSLPAISTVDPLLRVLIGVLVYHEALHRRPFGGLLLLVLLLLLVAAVIQLGRVETEESTPTAGPPTSPEPEALESRQARAGGKRAGPGSRE
jgi:hypothetical protein